MLIQREESEPLWKAIEDLGEDPFPDGLWKYKDPFVDGLFNFQVIDGETLYAVKYEITDPKIPLARLRVLVPIKEPPDAPRLDLK